MVDISEVRSTLLYFIREKMYNSMLAICKSAIEVDSREVSLLLYRSIFYLLNGQYDDGLREIEVIKSENDIKLACIVGLTYCYKYSESNDQKTRDRLDNELKETKSSTSLTDYYNTAFVFFALRKFDKALELVDKVLNDRISDADAWSLKGWILMYQTPLKDDYALIFQAFDTAINYNSKHLDSAIGKSEVQLRKRAYEDSINTSNRTIVRFPTLTSPLIQKIRILFCMQDWEQVTEVMNRLSNMQPKNLAAMKIHILMLLCKEANYLEAAKYIKNFTVELERVESNTAFLFYENSMLISRLAAKNKDVLYETFIMCEKAAKLTPNVTNYIVELGYQCLLQANIKDALRYYKAANKIDSTSFDSLLGMTLCELTENGPSENAKQQIFFLLELHEMETPPPLLLLMHAQITEAPEQAITLLEQASSRQLKLVENYFYSDEYLLKLDVDLMMNIVREYTKYAYAPSTGKTFPTNTKYSVVNSITNSLQIITTACPGLFEAHFLLAKILQLNEDNNAALQTLNHIITNIDPTSSDALILMANVQVVVQQFDRAAQSLEVGLSHNFKIRDNPLYHYIMGVVEKSRNNPTEAIKCFTTAFSLMQAQAKKPISNELILSDKAAIYKELIIVHTESGQPHEATKYMQDAMLEFKDTPEESKLLVLSAEQALSRDSVQAAIDILNEVKPGDLYYSDAKQKLADILLNKCRDRKAYLRQYQDVVNNIPDSKSYLKLADAYIKILEPSLAIEAYRTALEMNPNDPALISNMGQALVITHYYADAIQFYLSAIKRTSDSDLKIRLAELYIHLRRTAEAEALLSEELEEEKQRKSEDVTALQFRTRLYLLLTRCQEKSNNVRGAIASLKLARDNQSRVRKLLAISNKSVPDNENKVAVEISIRLAELTAGVKENQKAINHYKEALIIQPKSCKILGALAKMYMQVNFMELCQQTCTTLLSLDPDNEEGSVLMADIAFRKMDFDMAVFHFTQLVTKQPSNWPALVRLVEVMRRTGNLDEIPQYLEQGQRFSDKPTKEPGLAYATALYQWYSGNLNAALRNFNVARQDQIWGPQAIYSMIEICLNPDDELLGDPINDMDDNEYRDSRSMALKTAERLLRELKQTTNTFNSDDTLRCRILSNFLALATRDKPQIESALEDFISIASKEVYKEHLGPILGMSVAHTLLKQSQRAKTQLKRVAKNSWNFEDADYLERCWLLLADYYANSGKYEMSSELLRKVLQYNKSCCKAYEYSGFIAEKEQKYKDAANFYDSAWKYNGRHNPALGLKLAYCLMKCKKYAAAIDVSQHILKINPEYPRVKKDVLDKCINNLRI